MGGKIFVETHEKLEINLAGIGLRLAGVPERAAALMRNRYGAFLGGPAEAEWEIAWGVEARTEGPWEMEYEERGGVWKFGRGDFQAEWNEAEKRGRAEFDDSEYSFDAFLRAFISMTLLKSGGGLFHSCGLVKDGKGYLFAGVSGAGKSTLAARAGKEFLLSDELTALRRRGDTFEVCGTPFMGELNVGGRNVCVPIGRVFLLSKDSPRGRERVKPSEAAADLWSTLMCFSRSYGCVDRALDLCETLVSRLPVERISIDVGKDIWPQVE